MLGPKGKGQQWDSFGMSGWERQAAQVRRHTLRPRAPALPPRRRPPGQAPRGGSAPTLGALHAERGPAVGVAAAEAARAER
jgi:hypothetical protein